MLCYLFWWSSERDKVQGRSVVPVSFTDPDLQLTPHWLPASPEAVRWLEHYDNPVWMIGRTPLDNARRMHLLTACWPEPIDVPVKKAPTHFDDELPL